MIRYKFLDLKQCLTGSSQYWSLNKIASYVKQWDITVSSGLLWCWSFSCLKLVLVEIQTIEFVQLGHAHSWETKKTKKYSCVLYRTFWCFTPLWTVIVSHSVSDLEGKSHTTSIFTIRKATRTKWIYSAAALSDLEHVLFSIVTKCNSNW